MLPVVCCRGASPPSESPRRRNARQRSVQWPIGQCQPPIDALGPRWGGGTAGGSISFGSNYSDAAPKAAFAALTQAATAKSGVNISINTVDHNTFQNNISNYLQGTPNDLPTWFP